MKIVRRLILIQCLVALAIPAHAGLLSSIGHFLSRLPVIGHEVDKYGDSKASKKVNEKIDAMYDKALKCTPMETDGIRTVRDFMDFKPEFPGWQDLEDLKGVAENAKERAERKSDNDKVRHCYAGCKIRRKLGFKSARLAAFLKEMKDVSDCKASSHFEFDDYYATIAGAKAGKYVAHCRDFCGTQANAKRTGHEMLKASHAYAKKAADEEAAAREAFRNWLKTSGYFSH